MIFQLQKHDFSISNAILVKYTGKFTLNWPKMVFFNVNKI